MKLRSS